MQHINISSEKDLDKILSTALIWLFSKHWIEKHCNHFFKTLEGTNFGEDLRKFSLEFQIIHFCFLFSNTSRLLKMNIKTFTTLKLFAVYKAAFTKWVIIQLNANQFYNVLLCFTACILFTLTLLSPLQQLE